MFIWAVKGVNKLKTCKAKEKRVDKLCFIMILMILNSLCEYWSFVVVFSRYSFVSFLTFRPEYKATGLVRAALIIVYKLE